MKKMFGIAIVVSSMLFSHLQAQDAEFFATCRKVKDPTVTVQLPNGIDNTKGYGAGVIITRKVGEETVHYVWTAAHVVAPLRSVTKNDKGEETVVFEDVIVTKEILDKGRKNGEIKVSAKVVKYSPDITGEDLCLLKINGNVFGDRNVLFDQSDDWLDVGTDLIHVGSMCGHKETTVFGTLAAQNAALDGKAYDELSMTVYPGSSGGGVFRKSGDKRGECVGLALRNMHYGSLGFMIPIRRMREYVKAEWIEWALDAKIPMPTMADLDKMRVEKPLEKPRMEDVFKLMLGR